MTEAALLRRIAILVAIIGGALLAIAGGLTLMNVRADWALALGALICIAAPTLAGVRLWAMFKEDKSR
jgi:predicted cobalt transporter CbtA